MAIVGNSGSLLGSGLGPQIDAYPEVVRFNTYVTAGHEADVGSRTTIWVTSAWSAVPGYRPAPVSSCYVVMPVKGLRFRERYRADWEMLRDVEAAGADMQYIDDECFLELARVCPNPSSGIAFLWCLWHEIADPIDRACLYGFTHFDREVRYHYWTDEAPARTTHDSGRERRLFRAMTSMAPSEWRAAR
jgi:hypothetical protein